MKSTLMKSRQRNSRMFLIICPVSKALVVLEDGNKNAELSARNIADVKTAKTNTINVY